VRSDTQRYWLVTNLQWRGDRSRVDRLLLSLSLIVLLAWRLTSDVHAAESLIIAASPSIKLPIEAISRAFEETHSGVTVKIFYDSGLSLRQTIASVENSGRSFPNIGPIHLVAPAVDELITRLENKYYILPGTRRSYASTRLVLVVPESLADAPESFEALAGDRNVRVAVADPRRTEVGRMTEALLTSLGLLRNLKGRLDVAADSSGVLDHVLSGNADVGIILSSTAARESERVRLAAIAPDQGYDPPVHSIAMERSCPNRVLCEEFLDFVQTEKARSVLKRIGYGPPRE